jgi:ribosomal protein S18 acetylase RimI-like enzyme
MRASMHSEVCDATENDAETLIEIYSSPHLYHDREGASWFVKCYFDYHHIKVVRIDGGVVGALFWRVESERHHGIAVIDDLWINTEHRRRGLGEKLLRSSLEDAERFFAKDGYCLRKMVVTTAEDNEPARKLYEKLGFQKVATLKDLYSRGENELVYISTLSP